MTFLCVIQITDKKIFKMLFTKVILVKYVFGTDNDLVAKIDDSWGNLQFPPVILMCQMFAGRHLKKIFSLFKSLSSHYIYENQYHLQGF